MKTITIEIDPTGKLLEKGANLSRVQNACGILPIWALPALSNGLTMKDTVCAMYDFGVYEMTGGTVDIETGIHKYPEDPDLYPYLKLTLGDETMWCYESAILAFVDGMGQAFITRMD